MKTKKILLLGLLFVLVVNPLLAEDRYGLFLIDQSAPMNQPFERPPFRQAVEIAIRDINAFFKTTTDRGDTPYFKVVTFNEYQGYYDRSGWTTEQNEIKEMLLELYSEPAEGKSALRQSMYRAGDELSGLTAPDGQRKIFLYTDGGNRAFEKDLSVTPGGDSALFSQLVDAAVWKVNLFGAVQGGASSLDEDPSLSLPKNYKKSAGSTSFSFLEELAIESSGLFVKHGDGPDHGDLLTRNATTNNIAMKNGAQTVFQYFSAGKYSKTIYQSTSTNNGATWSVSPLGNGAKTERPVSAVRFQDRTYIFYKGRTTHNIYYSYSTNGTTWQGNAHVVPDATRTAPVAIVTDTAISVGFLDRNTSEVYSVFSQGVNPNGSIQWSDPAPTGIFADGPEVALAAIHDPYQDETHLFVTQAGSLSMWTQPPAPSFNFLAFIFPSNVARPALAVSPSDVYMVYQGANDWLYSARKSNGWSPTLINGERTDRPPALAFGDGVGLMTVYKQRGGDDIFFMNSSFGVEWTEPDDGTEHTRTGLGMLAYVPPLQCSISGVSSGSVGQSLSWSAIASGGQPPYTYTWRLDGVVVGSGSTYSRTFGATGYYWLELTVTAGDNTLKTSSRYIYINNGLQCTNLIDCPIIEFRNR